MQQAFLKNIFLLLLVNVIIKPIYIFGIDAQVQNQVGDNAYGTYFAIFNFCFLFQIFLDLGLQNYNSQYLSQNREKVKEQFAIVEGTRIMLIPIFALCVIVFANLIGYPNKYFHTFFGVGAIMSAQVGYVFLRSQFSAIGLYRTEVWLSALDKFLMILVLGYFIYVRKNISINLFISGQLIALYIALAVGYLLLRKRFTPRRTYNIGKSIKLLKKSLPFAVVFLLMTLYTRMDGVMLERLLDDNALSAGIYAKGYRLLDAANMFGYLFAVLLLPMFSNLIGDGKDLNPLSLTSSKLLFCISSMTSIACWYYAEDILSLIYIDIGHEHVMVFRWLMVSFWAMSMSYIFGSMITASGKLKTFNMIFIVGIIINWSLNLWLIPQRGAEGAAIATLITQFFVFIGQFILAKSRFHLRYDILTVAKAVGLLGIYFATIILLITKAPFHWVIQLVIFGILSILASIFAGFLRFNLNTEQ